MIHSIEFVFLQSVIPTWQLLKGVRWDGDDAIIHDPLSICDSVIVLDYVIDDEFHRR